MKRFATVFLVLAGLTAASAALAVDFRTKTPLPTPIDIGAGITAVLQCDNGNLNSAYYQDDTGRYGNAFNFGASSRLSYVTFAHYGWNTLAGPYSYDIECWDLTSCTPVAFVNGLMAADAFSSTQIELVNVCDYAIDLSGDVVVAIDANSCAVPTDCYPGVWFDDNLGATCPYVVDGSNLQCFSQMGSGGAFYLRVETDNCPVPVKKGSWGAVKQVYR